MKKIEITKVWVVDNTIRYQVREEAGLGILQNEVVELFIRYHGDDNYDYYLSKVPTSILLAPLALYILPITYFYNVEVVIPEMDKTLYESLSNIYDAYSKVYGPFKQEWRGKVTVGKVVANTPVENHKYDNVVFFSGGVDACHAGINNPGKRSLLVSIPDIEKDAKNDGPLREEKFSLIKNFSKVVDSDWLLISNNFNNSLCNLDVITNHLSKECALASPAYKFDGYPGIRYLANMCSIVPLGYLYGIQQLIMGGAFEQIEDKMLLNEDGANPALSDAIKISNICFAEQDGLLTRRSAKIKNIIDWCNAHHVRTKMWVCFRDDSSQCGYCNKCVRTQLEILCTGENPNTWGFDNFDERSFSRIVKSYRYRESNPCWAWDIIDTIDDSRTYPYCDDLLHWMKSIGYKEYYKRAEKKAKVSLLRRVMRRAKVFVLSMISK